MADAGLSFQLWQGNRIALVRRAGCINGCRCCCRKLVKFSAVAEWNGCVCRRSLNGMSRGVLRVICLWLLPTLNGNGSWVTSRQSSSCSSLRIRLAAALQQYRCEGRHRHMQLQLSLRKRHSCFEFSLCLSRACLGKMMHFLYKWRKSGHVSLPTEPPDHAPPTQMHTQSQQQHHHHRHHV
jgi:hypothetical protein